MEPWQSWAVVLTSGAVLYWYYTNHNEKSKSRAGRLPQPSQEAAALKYNRRRDDVRATGKPATPVPTDATSSDGGSTTERNKKRKAQKKTKVDPAPVAVTPTVTAIEDEVDDDKEWAQRLAGNKKGTNLAPPERKDGRQRTVKQGAAVSSTDFSATSSTTGAEADDDMSPVMSPSLGAASPSGKDVSDMLEAPAPGPAVLRLTEPVNPVQFKKQPQKQSSTPVQETKKQRQNRRKAEERKVQREQDEKERRVLMEKQLRTAREARGEPAKNGLQPAPVPASNSWTTAGANGASHKPAPRETPSGQAPLLDTFDQDSNTSGSNPPPSGASATTTGTNYAELPSEEEQTRWAMEDSGWSTVPASRRGRKKTAASATGQDEAESSDAGVSQPDRQETETVKLAGSIDTPVAAIDTPVAASDTNVSSGPSIFDQASHPNDSDWAVV